MIFKKKKAVGGILVAGTMKYADNILKSFATANSIVLSFVFSYYLLRDGDDNVTPTFLIGTFVIILATFLYSVQTVATSSSIAGPSLPLLYPSTSDVLEECHPVKIIEH